MLRYLPYMIIFVLLLGILVVLESVRPDLMNELFISVDVFGLTDSAKNEQTRLSEISDLPITYEEKQVLIGHTVFLGASTDMVKLALGDPKKMYAGDTAQTIILFVYYLPNDKRPTILEFHNDKLEKAYKGSAIDLQ